MTLAVLRMDDTGKPALKQEERDDSFESLYRRYAPEVAKFFANRRFSREEVEDLTAATFLKALRSYGNLRRRDKRAAWLFRIVHNLWCNACRDRSTARRVMRDYEAAERSATGREGSVAAGRRQGGDPLREALVEERHRRLRDAIGELSPALRNVVLLRLDQDRGYEEIATALRIPVGTVKSRLNAAQRQLRKLLGDAYGEVTL